MFGQPTERHASLMGFPGELAVGDALEEPARHAHLPIELRQKRFGDRHPPIVERQKKKGKSRKPKTENRRRTPLSVQAVEEFEASAEPAAEPGPARGTESL